MKNLKVCVSFLLVVSFMLMACEKTESSKFEELNLLDKGFPIKIKAPDSAAVRVSNMAFIKDVTVIKEPSYNVQILVSKATKDDEKSLLAKLKSQVRENPFFNEMLLEEEKGFLFKNIIDSLASYDFRYVKIKGGQEYIFQTGLSSTFDKNEAEVMYDSVKYQDKK